MSESIAMLSAQYVAKDIRAVLVSVHQAARATLAADRQP